jgi:CheY-like chemotaxis protein
VLVVEDDHEIREALRGILIDDGFSVACARDGQQALDYLRQAQARPSVIVLDMMLPVMSGGEFLEQIKAEPELRTIPVLICSAGDYPELSGKLPRIRKPFIYRVLLDLISQITTSQRPA